MNKHRPHSPQPVKMSLRESLPSKCNTGWIVDTRVAGDFRGPGSGSPFGQHSQWCNSRSTLRAVLITSCFVKQCQTPRIRSSSPHRTPSPKPKPTTGETHRGSGGGGNPGSSGGGGGGGGGDGGGSGTHRSSPRPDSGGQPSRETGRVPPLDGGGGGGGGGGGDDDPDDDDNLSGYRTDTSERDARRLARADGPWRPKHKEHDDLKFPGLPDQAGFRAWENTVCARFNSAPGRPDGKALRWVRRVEGRRYPDELFQYVPMSFTGIRQNHGGYPGHRERSVGD